MSFERPGVFRDGVFLSEPLELGLELGPDGGIGGIIVHARQLVGILLEVVELPFVERVEVDELVALGAHAVVPRDVVRAGIFVVLVVEALTPIGWCFAFE